MARGIRVLMWCAVGMPILYFATVFLSALFFPGYSHITQYASELGSAQAPHPEIFNGGILLAGVAGVAGGIGLALAVRALGGYQVLGALAGLGVALFGVSLVFGAVFPMPDPRHGGFGLGMAIQLAPFLLTAGLWRVPTVRNLRAFLIIVGLGMLALFAIMMGVGAMVTRSNVGLFQRAYALTAFPWVGVAGFVLGRRLRGQA